MKENRLISSKNKAKSQLQMRDSQRLHMIQDFCVQRKRWQRSRSTIVSVRCWQIQHSKTWPKSTNMVVKYHNCKPKRKKMKNWRNFTQKRMRKLMKNNMTTHSRKKTKNLVSNRMDRKWMSNLKMMRKRNKRKKVRIIWGSGWRSMMRSLLHLPICLLRKCCKMRKRKFLRCGLMMSKMS